MPMVNRPVIEFRPGEVKTIAVETGCQPANGNKDEGGQRQLTAGKRPPEGNSASAFVILLSRTHRSY